MPEDFTPRLRIVVESLWGDRPTPSGTPGAIDINPDIQAAVVRALREAARGELDKALGFLVVLRHGNPDTDHPGLDFDAPNQPTTADVEYLLHQAERIVAALEVLRELAPTVFPDDDDGDDDPEPDPAPEPSTGAVS